MKIAEFRTVHEGPVTRLIEYRDEDSEPDSFPIDLTGWRVLEVTSSVKPGQLPTVTITFVARLVSEDSVAS